MPRIRLVLIDRQPLFRAGLAVLLEKHPDLDLLGQAADLAAAEDLVAKRRPDVLLLEVPLAGEATFETVANLQAGRPQLKVVFLADGLSEWPVVQALRIGAKGYLTKAESSDTLAKAIRAVAEGGTWFSEPLASRLVQGPAGLQLAVQAGPALSKLSRCELDVMRRLSTGERVRTVASDLNRSIRTINNHRTNLMKKLGIHNRVELARFAVESGLVVFGPRFPGRASGGKSGK